MRKPIRWIVAGALCAVACVVAGTLVANALTTSPEIDRANAKLRLSGQLTSRGCVGEDTTDYLTLSGTWKGAETQVLPDPTDYGLTGPVTVTGIKWTINGKTKRGVLTATIALTKSTPAGAVVYSGPLTLVTQGLPSTAAAVPGRGWISASVKLPDEGVASGDDFLIANTEFMISPTGAIGMFGDAAGSFGTPNFAAVTNVAPTAGDGTC
jgi:hypothetical protein